MLIILLWYLSPPTHAVAGTFSFVTTAVSVMEEDGEVAEICIRLNLATGVTLGCEVTATLATLNGNNASMLFYLELNKWTTISSALYYNFVTSILTYHQLS